MKKYIIAIAALAAVVSCKSLKEEWDPVFTVKNDDGAWLVPVTEQYLKDNFGMEQLTTIKDLKALYNNKPVLVSGNVWIKGQVVSSDVSGNIYKELYIQDATGAIDIKVGQGNLSAKYPQGMNLYILCDGLTLGSYEGMPQLGFTADVTSDKYETSYIELQTILDQHIFRGFTEAVKAPAVVTEDQLKKSLSDGFQGALWGVPVTLKGLQYGATSKYATDSFKRIFVFLNVDPFKDKEATFNRMRLSVNTFGVTTWAMSKSKFIEYLDNGNFDEAATYDGVGMNQVFDEATGLTVKQTLRANANGVATSQYFHIGSTPIAIRTSGFAKFADTEIDPAIIGDLTAEDGAVIDVTGILTVYQGDAQLVLVDEPSVSVKKQ